MYCISFNDLNPTVEQIKFMQDSFFIRASPSASVQENLIAVSETVMFPNGAKYRCIGAITNNGSAVVRCPRDALVEIKDTKVTMMLFNLL